MHGPTSRIANTPLSAAGTMTGTAASSRGRARTSRFSASTSTWNALSSKLCSAVMQGLTIVHRLAQPEHSPWSFVTDSN